MFENSLLLSPSLSNQMEALGLCAVDFKGDTFFRVIPSLSNSLVFSDGFYHFEIEQHGRWCSESGRLTINLDAGSWQLVLSVGAGQRSRWPDVNSPNASLEVNWITGNAYWDALVINAELTSAVLQLDFKASAFFVPSEGKQSNDNRRLAFWMLDEFLFRHRSDKASIPFRPSERPLRDLVPSVAAAQQISASDLQTASKLDRDRRVSKWPSVWVVRDALVVGRPAMIASQSNGELVIHKESLLYEQRLSIAQESCAKSLKISTPNAEYIDCAAPLCGEWAENIWHWFLEYVPKAVAIEAEGFKGDYLVPFSSSVYRKSLELLGVESQRIREYVHSCIEVSELYIAEPVKGHHLDKFPWVISEMNRRLRGAVTPKDLKRLYIARRGNRKVTNEESVLSALAKYGFQRIYMEDYSIVDQIALAAGAECIAGPHGAGMTAALFLKPGGTMIEFFSPVYINPCMTPVCEVLHLRYFMITSRMHLGEVYAHGQNIEVDIPILKLALATALA